MEKKKNKIEFYEYLIKNYSIELIKGNCPEWRRIYVLNKINEFQNKIKNENKKTKKGN